MCVCEGFQAGLLMSVCRSMDESWFLDLGAVGISAATVLCKPKPVLHYNLNPTMLIKQ